MLSWVAISGVATRVFCCIYEWLSPYLGHLESYFSLPRNLHEAHTLRQFYESAVIEDAFMPPRGWGEVLCGFGVYRECRFGEYHVAAQLDLNALQRLVQHWRVLHIVHTMSFAQN